MSTFQIKKTIVIVLSILLLLLLLGNVYQFLFNQNNSDKENKELTQLKNEKLSIEEEYNLSKEKLLNLSQELENLENKLGISNDTIGFLKAKIAKISRVLDKDRITTKERNSANQIISDLNAKIKDLSDQVDDLKKQNADLTLKNQQLTEQNQELTNNLNLAIAEKQKNTEPKESETKNQDDKNENVNNPDASLSLSNFNIKALSKTKDIASQTLKAKHAKYLNIDFVADPNKSLKSGNKSLYIIVVNPEGNTITPNDIETFTTKNGEELIYSQKLEFDYQKDQPNPIKIEVALEHGKKGIYTIQVYFNGDMVGNSQIQLK